MIFEQTAEAKIHRYWVSLTNIEEIIREMVRLYDSMAREHIVGDETLDNFLEKGKSRLIEHVVAIFKEVGVNPPDGWSLVAPPHISLYEFSYRIHATISYLNDATFYARNTGSFTDEDLRNALSVFYETKCSDKDILLEEARLQPSQWYEHHHPERVADTEEHQAFSNICRGLGQVRQY